MTKVVFQRNVNFHVGAKVFEYTKWQTVDTKDLKKNGVKGFEKYVSEEEKKKNVEKKEGKKIEKEEDAK